MTPSGFGRDQAWSVFEGMRPEAGVALDRLAVATYSLDLVALAALMLSLGAGREEELLAGPLEFADAVRTLKDRIVVLHQKGRMSSPSRYREVLLMLDGAIRSVVPETTASWHPKAMLGRYLGPRGATSWRLWLGSRNLTGGHDREAGLLLVGSPGKAERPAGVSTALRSLFKEGGWSADQLQELDRVRWSSPDGSRLLSLGWREMGSHGSLVRAPARARSMLVISPFADPSGLGALPCRGDRRLLTTTADAAAFAGVEGLQVRIVGSPSRDGARMDPPETGDDGAPTPIEPRGLHAKLVLFRGDAVNRLWIGSANATGRGLLGRNAELMAELEITVAHAEALEQYWSLSPEPGDAPEADPEIAEREAAQRRLDDALCVVLAAGFRIERAPDGLRLVSDVDLDSFLADHRLQVGLMTLPDQGVEWPEGARAVILGGPGIPLRLQTVLVDFRAETREAPVVDRCWTQPVEFPDLDLKARDRVALAAYIGPARFAAWLRAQLEGGAPLPGTTTWTGEPKPRARGQGGSAPARPFTLETVLASWARDPAAFEARVRDVDGVLRAFVDQFASADEATVRETEAMLHEIMPFWTELRASLGMGGEDGA